MDRKKYQELAEFLINAEKEKREVVRLTSELPDLTPEQAYRIQEELVNLKLANGHRIIGPKMGLTSFAKMQQMKVNEPIYGYVLDDMLVAKRREHLFIGIQPSKSGNRNRLFPWKGYRRSWRHKCTSNVGNGLCRTGS
mgnify:CR=1 FL=1